MKVEYDFSQAKRGAVIPQTGKTRITIHIDNDVLKIFREQSEAAGKGYQTMMNEALRQYIQQSHEPLEEALRRVVREELERIEH